MKFDFLSESDQAYFIHKASTLVEALPYIISKQVAWNRSWLVIEGLVSN